MTDARLDSGKGREPIGAVPGGSAVPVRWLRLGLWIALLACSALYVVWTWRWPLLGDSSLIHYICFLMQRGWAPYRTLGDMNMPGSFLIEWSAMHVYGSGSMGWRLFDLTVLAATAAGLVAIAWPYDRLAGVFAAVVFMVVHGRDGLNDTGQRDLAMAALLVLAYAGLFLVWRRGSGRSSSLGSRGGSTLPAFLFGFCIAAAGTIKPTALPLGIVLLAAMAVVLRGQGKPAAQAVLAGTVGFLLPPAVCFVFLVREQALGAFAHNLTTVVPYFASLGRRPPGFLLLHSVSPLLPLAIVWVVLAAGQPVANGAWRKWKHGWTEERWERAALLLGAAAMLAGFMLQGKGFPYHRYPFLVLLLAQIGIELTRALRQRGVWLLLGAAGLAYGAFVLAPQSVMAVRKYDWRNQGSIAMMQADLTRLGGSALSGRVQCIDTISGCTDTLYRMRLEPTTGLLSDFLVFGPEQNPAVHEARARFLGAVEARPPEVIVVVSSLFPSGPGEYRKLARWPEFASWLAARYRLCAQRTPAPVRWWGRVEQPPGYRVYVLARCSNGTCGDAIPAGCGDL